MVLFVADEFCGDELRAVVLKDAPGILAGLEFGRAFNDLGLEISLRDMIGACLGEFFGEDLVAGECLRGLDLCLGDVGLIADEVFTSGD